MPETPQHQQQLPDSGQAEESCDPATTFSIKMVSSPSDITKSTISRDQSDNALTLSAASLDAYVPVSDSDESLSIVTKDSIEDLPSTVPRSPKSAKFPDELRTLPNEESQQERPNSSSPPRSPRRTLKKKLTVNLNGADFDLEKKRRPLSPFTSGGMLRKLTGGSAPSAPAAVTEFGPRVEDEVQQSTETVIRGDSLKRTTRSERGGRGLMGFLGRRVRTA
jgi:hypothetical protein